MTEPFSFRIENPNITGSEKQVIYLIASPDDNKNKLVLTVTNTSGTTISFNSSSTPFKLNFFNLFRGLPDPSAWQNIQISASDGNWQTQSYQNNRARELGQELKPTTGVSLNSGDKINFTLTNIAFSQSDLDYFNNQDRTQGDLQVEYFTPSEGQTPLKLFLRSYAPQPQTLENFEVDFIQLEKSQDWTWNVKQNNQELWLPNKSEEYVYTNSISDLAIETRLAFRLTNQDRTQDLKLTSQSKFKVSFLPGTGAGALADAQDLVNNIQIKELNAGDSQWQITQATEDILIWTLQPKQDITLSAGGGTVSFVIDAIEANGQPATAAESPGITEMYVEYQHIPLPQGSGDYDDGYRPVTIEKYVPTPQILSFEKTPDKDIYEPGELIALSWQAFAIEDLQLHYTDFNGIPTTQNINFVDSLSVTPPLYVSESRTTNYVLQGSNFTGSNYQVSARVSSLLDSLAGKTFDVADNVNAESSCETPDSGAATMFVYSVRLSFTNNKTATLEGYIRQGNHQGKGFSHSGQVKAIENLGNNQSTIQIGPLSWDEMMTLSSEYGCWWELDGKGPDWTVSLNLQYTLIPELGIILDLTIDQNAVTNITPAYCQRVEFGAIHHSWGNTFSLKIVDRGWKVLQSVQIVSKLASNKVIDVAGANTDNGTHIQLYDANGSDAQSWYLEDAGNGYYYIVSKLDSNKVLNVTGSYTGNGTQIILWNNDKTDNELWQLLYAGNGYYYIASKLDTNKVLNVYGSNTDNGTNIILWDKVEGSNNELWQLQGAS